MGAFDQPRSRRRASLIIAVAGYLNNAVLVVQGIVLVPLYLQFFSAGLYGFWMAAGGVLGALSFLDMGLSALLIQRVSNAYGRKENNLAGDYFLAAMVPAVALGLVLLATAWVLSVHVPGWIHADDPATAELLTGTFRLAALASVLMIWNNSLQGFAGALQRPLWPRTMQVAGAVGGLGTTVVLLFQGWGLWALPIGLVVKSGVPFTFNLGYASWMAKGLGASPRRMLPRVPELLRLSPALFLGRIGKFGVERIEPFLLQVVLADELLTAAYVFTRRAAEQLNRILQISVVSTFPGFSHLWGEGDLVKARRVFGWIFSAALLGGCVLLGGYIAANREFVSLWVGEENFLSQRVTFFMGTALLFFPLHSMLFQATVATGGITRASLLDLGEALVRAGLMIVGLHLLGPVGLPLAMTISGLLVCGVLFSSLRPRLGLTGGFTVATLRRWAAAAAILALAVLTAEVIDTRGWVEFGLLGAGFVAVAGGVACVGDPRLLRAVLERLRRRRGKSKKGARE